MKKALSSFSFPLFQRLSLWERYHEGVVEGGWVAIRSIIKHVLEKMGRKVWNNQKNKKIHIHI